jgi:hypothetical protein
VGIGFVKMEGMFGVRCGLEIAENGEMKIVKRSFEGSSLCYCEFIYCLLEAARVLTFGDMRRVDKTARRRVTVSA